MEINYTTYYTKSLKDDSPAKNFLVHEYHGENKTACGKNVSGDRWHKYSFYLKSEITCKKCLEKLEKRK